MRTLIRWLEQAGLALAVVCTLMIMLTIGYDAFSRYVFNAPLSWAFELVTYYLMIIAIYFAMSATFTHGDHINLDIFQAMMPPRVRAWVDCAWSVMGAVVFWIIAYGTWEDTMHALQRNEFLPGIIVWPAWLSHLPIPLGAGLLAARLTLHAYLLARHGQDPAVAANSEPME